MFELRQALRIFPHCHTRLKKKGRNESVISPKLLVIYNFIIFGRIICSAIVTILITVTSADYKTDNSAIPQFCKLVWFLSNRCLFELAHLLQAANLGHQRQEAESASGRYLGIGGEGGGTGAAEALSLALNASGRLLKGHAAASNTETADDATVRCDARSTKDQLILAQTVSLDAHFFLEANALTLAGSTDTAGDGSVETTIAADAATEEIKGALVNVSHVGFHVNCVLYYFFMFQTTHLLQLRFFL
jgi:hypothetical protein